MREFCSKPRGSTWSGEAADGATALTEAGRLHPEVVLLDVQLPDIDGFDVAARLTGHDDGPVVILVSSRDSSDFGPLVIALGRPGLRPQGRAVRRPAAGAPLTSLNRALVAIAFAGGGGGRGGSGAARLLRTRPNKGAAVSLGLLIGVLVRRHRAVRVVAPAEQRFGALFAAVGFLYCPAR